MDKVYSVIKVSELTADAIKHAVGCADSVKQNIAKDEVMIEYPMEADCDTYFGASGQKYTKEEAKTLLATTAWEEDMTNRGPNDETQAELDAIAAAEDQAVIDAATALAAQEDADATAKLAQLVADAP